MDTMRRILAASAAVVVTAALTACGTLTGGAGTQTSASATPLAVGSAHVASASPAAQSSSGTTATATAVPAATASSAAAPTKPASDVLAQSVKPHTVAAVAGPAATIMLNGAAIATTSSGVKVNGASATIVAAGTYRLTGSLNNGQIVVDTADKGEVRLVLSGVDIRNASGATIYFAKAGSAVIELADGTQNSLTDGKTYTFERADVDEPNAAIFSRANLTLTGKGALTVNAQFNDGIASKDGLVIADGAISVNAADDGIRGKDYLVVSGGALTVKAGGDGLKADNDTDATKGYIAIDAGTFAITAGGDAIEAHTHVRVNGGTFTLNAAGGSTARIAATESGKGLKAGNALQIGGGTFKIDAADDALHANNALTVTDGTFSIATGDDGIHADGGVTIDGGDIRITRSYEGIESAVININAGTIHLVSSDDGINVAGGAQGSGMLPGGRPGGAQTTYTGKLYLYIRGGYVVVDSGGDGLDANGAIEMTGGTVVVHGPTAQMNSAVDYDGSFKMTGGILVAAGSSGMAQAPGTSSTQQAALIYFNASQAAGTLVRLQDASGRELVTFAPSKAFQSLAFSSPELAKGASVDVLLGGTTTGADKDGLRTGGTYSGGTRFANFTASSVVTTVGTGGARRRP